MFKHSLLALLATGSMLVSAQAQQSQELVSTNGWAIYADAGIAEQMIDVDGGYEDESGKGFAPAIGVSYRFNENFSVLVNYADHGEADLFDFYQYYGNNKVNFTASVESTALSVMAQYESERMVQNWSFGGRLGLTSWDADAMLTGTFQGQSEKDSIGSDSGVSIIGGLFAVYSFTQQLDMTFSADWFVAEPNIEIVEGHDTELQVSRYAVGMRYWF